MDLRRLVFDAEFDSLSPEKVWVLTFKDMETGEYFEFLEPPTKPLWEIFGKNSILIGHNIIDFDIPNLNRIWGVDFTDLHTIDTLIVSRLLWYKRPGGHSLDNLGKRLGMSKVFVDIYDDPSQIELYRERCKYDVDITEAVFLQFQNYVYDPSLKDALRVEHELAKILREVHENGFYFDIDQAYDLLEEVLAHMKELEEGMKASIPQIKEEKQYILRKNKDGTPSKRTLDLVGPDYKFMDGDTYIVYTYRDFNPASPKERVDLLWESGWNPTERTKTHNDVLRLRNSPEKRKRLERLSVYGWKCNEENLKTLPKDAPDGARRLAEWLTLEGRRSDLVEWIEAYNPDTHRIHGKFSGIGSWTHRCSHSNPNQANIFSEFHIPKGKTEEDLTPVERIKYVYDGRLRSLWCVPHDKVLLGCDAEGIQLRGLAHIMGDEEYIKAVQDGRKEDETDVHNVNRRALSIGHLTRDDAKTFIYAWLLGAATPKVASILSTTKEIAGEAVKKFVNRFPGLKRIKTRDIPRDARRGYFIGIDKRKVVCDSEHLMLAGYLQNFEKVIMAHATVYWYHKLKEEGLKFKLVDFVHDEWQLEVENEEDGHRIGKRIVEGLERVGVDLQSKIRITGEYKIGRNWRETH